MILVFMSLKRPRENLDIFIAMPISQEDTGTGNLFFEKSNNRKGGSE